MSANELTNVSRRASRASKTAALELFKTITKKQPSSKVPTCATQVQNIAPQRKRHCKTFSGDESGKFAVKRSKRLSEQNIKKAQKPSSYATSPLKVRNKSNSPARAAVSTVKKPRSAPRGTKIMQSNNPDISKVNQLNSPARAGILKVKKPRSSPSITKIKPPRTPPSVTKAKKSQSPLFKKPTKGQKRKQPSSQKASSQSIPIKAEKVDNTIKYVGAHVSAAGGLSLAVERAVEIGAKSFALFLKSNHQWSAKKVTKKEASLFKKKCSEFGFLPQLIVPHGSYLLNCGAPNNDILDKSRSSLLEELQRCEQLGLTLFNFHPGSSCGKISQDECISRIIKSINLALEGTTSVTILIENMCGQGHTVGGKFEELKAIIDGIDSKSRIGVCLDTCHAFAAGYNLASKEGYEDMMQEFDSVIGLKYLKAMHLNDSLGDIGSHLDRHANIGFGQIGTEGFRMIMNDSRLNGIPMVLETPPVMGYGKEIKTLNDLKTP